MDTQAAANDSGELDAFLWQVQAHVAFSMTYKIPDETIAQNVLRYYGIPPKYTLALIQDFREGAEKLTHPADPA